jgi:hypothetical protein
MAKNVFAGSYECSVQLSKSRKACGACENQGHEQKHDPNPMLGAFPA